MTRRTKQAHRFRKSKAMKISEHFEYVGRPVAYYPRMSMFLGSVKATIFLCQFLFWNGKQKDPNGWIYKSQNEIRQETGLSRREQETARKQLAEHQFIEQKYRGIPRRLYYRINLNVLDKAWDAWIKATDLHSAQYGNDETGIQDG